MNSVTSVEQKEHMAPSLILQFFKKEKYRKYAEISNRDGDR